MPRTLKRALELKVPPGVLVLIMAVSMWFVSRVAPTFTFRVPFRPIVAALLAVCGIVIAGLGAAEFRRVRTTLNPIKPGSSSSLVTRGVYQRTRNPMYLGFLLLLIGVATGTANLLAFLFLPLFVFYMNEFQIKPEERALATLFGDEFENYRSGVGRWI